MKYIISYLLLILFALPLFGQTKGNISGCITDSTNKALQDANVLFTKADSLVAVISTGQKGCFSLKLDIGIYTIRISHIGYEEYTKEVNLPIDGVSLPTIILKESAVALDTVTIEEQLFTVELNKSIFKIPGRIKKSSTDIYQILATVPALIVNPIERTIALAGSKNRIVMVNNIRRDKSYLSMLTPEDIDRVEIIRYPGSRYKDVDGIINIISKASVAGQSGNIGGRLDPMLKQGYADGYYRYASGKVSASLFVHDFFFDENSGEESIVRDVYVGDNVTHTERNSNKKLLSMNSVYVGSNIDYIISPKTFIILGGSYVASPQSIETPYTGSVFSGNQKKYDFESSNKSDSDYDNYKLDLYYQADFNKTSSVSIDADLNSTKTAGNSLYKEYRNNGYFYEDRQSFEENRQTLNAQVNFQQQFSKVRFEEGYRLYRQDNKFDGNINGIDNKTEHNEWRHYLYVNLLGDIRKKLVYQTGLGFDMAKVTFNNVTNTHNELTPNVMFRYIMKNRQNLTLNYSIDRKSPPSSALNPVPVYVDTSRVITGNPDLKPYYQNRVRLAYELYKNKSYIQASLQYSSADNYITQKETLDESGIYRITYVNTTRYSAATAALNLSISVFKWWKLILNGLSDYNIYKDDSQTQLNKNYWTHSLRIVNSINYKKLSANVTIPVTFRTVTLTGYSKSNSESFLNASYRLNNSWTFLGNIRYLLPMRSSVETYTDNFSEIFYSNNADRYLRFSLGVRYSFQKGKQSSHAKQKKVKQYDDEASVGAKAY